MLGWNRLGRRDPGALCKVCALAKMKECGYRDQKDGCMHDTAFSA